MLGIESGGLESAEGLLLARYFMYSQVYYHPVRCAYDFHLQDFLLFMYSEGLPTNIDDFLNLTDNEVLVELRKAAADSFHPGHDAADRIVNRKHYRVLYERNPQDAKKNTEAGEAVYRAACEKFGKQYFHHDRYTQRGSGTIFPVKTRDGRIMSSLAVSNVLERLPLVNIDLVLVAPELLRKAKEWLRENRHEIISQVGEDEP